jgi:hypothetical protein
MVSLFASVRKLQCYEVMLLYEHNSRRYIFRIDRSYSTLGLIWLGVIEIPPQKVLPLVTKFLPEIIKKLSLTHVLLPIRI